VGYSSLGGDRDYRVVLDSVFWDPGRVGIIGDVTYNWKEARISPSVIVGSLAKRGYQEGF
jgi:hypothetical protein